MTSRLQVYGYLAAIVLLIVFFLSYLGEAIGPLAFSFFLTYLLFPVARKLEAYKVPRALVAFAMMALAGVLVILLLVWILPGIYRDMVEFLQTMPATFDRVLQLLHELSVRFNFETEIPVSRQEAVAYFTDKVSQLSGSLVGTATNVLQTSVTSVVRVILVILNLSLIPLFFFYLMTAYDRLKREIISFVPPRHRSGVLRAMDVVNEVLSGYFRGQLLVCLSMGALYALGLTIVGLPFGALIGFMAGFANLIPYFGFVLGIGTSVVVALANLSGAGVLIGIAVVFMVVQVIESFVLTPRIVGNKVGLNPLLTILVLIVGGNIGGLVGMLSAIPVGALTKRVYEDQKKKYLQSDFYRGAGAVSGIDTQG